LQEAVEIFSGKNPAFDVAGMMAIEHELDNPEFCLSWLTNYERSGGKFSVPGPCDWREMPPEVLRKITEHCQAYHLSAVLRQMEGLH